MSQLAAFGFIIQGDAADDDLGWSVSTAGDINGDGFDDIIIGAPNHDAGGNFAGAAWVIFGKGGGFTNIDLSALAPSAGFRIQGDELVDSAGLSVSSAGDINGDGFDEIIIGAPFAEIGAGEASEGISYVLFGKAGGFTNIDLTTLSAADGFLIEGDDAGAQSGYSVSSAGDINGDGFDDLIIGAYRGDNGGTDAGEAYVIFGKASGFANIEVSTLAAADGFVIIGDIGGDNLGSVSSAGDINNDGFDDLIVGALGGDNGGTDAGEAYVIFGKAAGFTNIDLTALTLSQGFIIQGDTTNDLAGFSVGAAGDFNADGFDDVIIGAIGADNVSGQTGMAYVIFGKASGFTNIDLGSLTAAAGFAIVGDSLFDQLGFSVSTAGDVNGDGFDDVIIGARYGDDGGVDAGEAYVIYGKAGGFSTIEVGNLAPADGFVIQGDAADDWAGRSVSTAGDINGDGFDDLVVGAPEGDNGGADAGEAYVIFGRGTSSTRFPLVFDLASDISPASGFSIIGDQTLDQLGRSVSSAGDINNDGFDDIVVGAPQGDNGGSNAGEAYVIFGKSAGFVDIDVTTLTAAQGFIIQGDATTDQAGFSVSSAGDINGDGFADIIVGAPFADVGGTDAGDAYVIFGKASGFTDIDLTTLSAAQGFMIQGDLGGDQLGRSVASAGDINNDGFDDIIVGAFLGDNGGVNAGEAYVLFGKASGFTNIDLSTLTAAQGFIIQGDSANDYAGNAVASAGDINGDGFDDMIIAAFRGDNGGTNAGEAYVVFGKASGFANIDLTTLAPADGFIIQGDAADDLAGISVSSAGDVNGDGIDDLIVGAEYNDVAGTGAGAAYVIFGRTGGFANIDLSSLPPGEGFTILGDLANDVAGYSVAGAGDVNGDGFDDIIVGAPFGDDGAVSAGEAYVIFGKSDFTNVDLSTLTATQGFIVQGSTNTENAGSSVAAAGDVNGDGIDDLIVGAKNADGGGGNSGEAHVIFGRAMGTPFFPLVFDLGEDVNPVTGATIIGDAAGDDAGFSVSSAGDVNNDGYDDVIVSAHEGDNGGTNAGEAYVLFGGAGGIPDIDLTTLTLADGFIIQGDDPGDIFGWSVSDAGDFNNDGFDDIIVGARLNDDGGPSAGKAWLIFGKASGFANIDLTSLTIAQGFSIVGDFDNDQAGWSVSSAGDINNDGFDDIILGAPRADDGGSSSGEAYVIFGKSSGFANIDITTLAAADGFKIVGENPNDRMGSSVCSAGDVNGDGFDDIIVGAYYNGYGDTYSGTAYVIFGKSSGFGTIDLGALDSADGFAIRSYDQFETVGWSVSSAGDINGDGFADLVIGTKLTSQVYVLFGKETDDLGNVDLAALTPSDGFVIQGAPGVDYTGYSVSSAGDLNGDGFDDILVGTKEANLAYVIYGKSAGFTDVDLADLAAADGFIIQGESASDRAGASVSAAGDVNGDGFDDLMVGAPNDESGGANAGAAYIIYGRGFGARDDAASVAETAGSVTGNLFADNGLGPDISSGLLDLEIATVNGSAANVGGTFALPSNAQLAVQPDGSYSYSPNGQYGYLISAAKGLATGAVNTSTTDSFTYGFADGSSATVTVTITGVDNAADELWGDATNNSITGTAGINNLFRLTQGGNDTATGGDFLDDIIFGATFTAADSVNGGGGFDDLYLDGNYTAPVLFGISTLTNVERIIVAAGFSYNLVSNDTTVAGGQTLVVSGIALTSGDSLIFDGSAETNGFFQLSGGAGSDVLIGGALADSIGGGGGVDQMSGGGGDDLYSVDASADQVIETSLFDGVDKVFSSVSYTLGANVDNLDLSGTLDINGTGNGLDNVISGNAGANALDGGGGADTLTGKDGNDTYVVDNAGDQVVETSALATGGTDLVQSSITYTLGANVENLTLTGAGAINAIGNGLANVLVGNNSANTLNGGANADLLQGAGGDDTYNVDNVGDNVVELAGGGIDEVRSSITYTLGANVENLTLLGAAAINATGNGLANTITGNGAANTLNGGTGADKLKGGGGNDTYQVDNLGDRAIEVAGDGVDIVFSSVSFSLAGDVENLTLVGTGSVKATGNALVNILVGNTGNNTLNGGALADTMQGGAGNDIYVVDDGGDVVTEGSGGGTDLVQSSITYTLGADVENLTLTGSTAINGTGNGLVNTIAGSKGANILNGGVGADVMKGGSGNDIMIVDNVGDTAVEGFNRGTDEVQSSVTFTLGAYVENLTLTGASAINGIGNGENNALVGNGAANLLQGKNGNDTLFGNGGIDTLEGEIADDRLYGGDGNDSLEGGSGDDRFYFDTALNAVTNVDAILDFQAADDAIYLDRDIFTGITVNGTLAGTAFRAGSAALDVDDRIIYDAATGQIFYDGDGLGGAAQILFATVTAGTVLTRLDFVGFI